MWGRARGSLLRAGHAAAFLANTRPGLLGSSQWCHSSLSLWKLGYFLKGSGLKKCIKTATCALFSSPILVLPGKSQRLLEAGLASLNPKSGFPFMSEPQLNQQPVLPQIQREAAKAVKSAGKSPKIVWGTKNNVKTTWCGPSVPPSNGPLGLAGGCVIRLCTAQVHLSVLNNFRRSFFKFLCSLQSCQSFYMQPNASVRLLKESGYSMGGFPMCMCSAYLTARSFRVWFKPSWDESNPKGLLFPCVGNKKVFIVNGFVLEPTIQS